MHAIEYLHWWHHILNHRTSPFLLCVHNLLNKLFSCFSVTIPYVQPSPGLISHVWHLVSQSHSILSSYNFKSRSKVVNRRADYLGQLQGVGTGLLREVMNHQIQRSDQLCSTLTVKRTRNYLWSEPSVIKWLVWSQSSHLQCSCCTF